jgi:hypothetical protein
MSLLLHLLLESSQFCEGRIRIDRLFLARWLGLEPGGLRRFATLGPIVTLAAVLSLWPIAVRTAVIVPVGAPAIPAITIPLAVGAAVTPLTFAPDRRSFSARIALAGALVAAIAMLLRASAALVAVATATRTP